MAQVDRISRKAIRQPDEFHELTLRAVDWFRANQSAVVGAASAAAIVVVAVLGFNWNAGRQSAAAAVRFDAARSRFEASDYTGAVADFEGVSQDYPRTPAGRLAILYRAHALGRKADAAAAATAYGEYLASGPATDYLRQEALLGLARAKEAQDDRPGALATYRDAADVAGPFRTPARMAVARLLEATGDAAGAKAIYAELATAPDLDADSRQLVASKVPPVPAPVAPAVP
jgi:predicted negative regulator of RcsB-dependent stress response